MSYRITVMASKGTGKQSKKARPAKQATAQAEPEKESKDNNNDPAPPVIPASMIQEVHQIGFFNPDYKALANIQHSTRNPDGNYVYWDVFAFTARVQQYIRNKESRKEDLEGLSQVLPYCLQKSARTWWEEEVEEHLKEMFLEGLAGIDLFYKNLESRFKDTGKKLAQAARSNTNGVVMVKEKKGRPEKPAFWDQKKGETLDECSIRRRKAGT